MTRSQTDTVSTDDTVPELRFKQRIGLAEWPCIGEDIPEREKN